MNDWDQLEREPAKAYHAFAHYRELGSSRSVDKAFRSHASVCLGKPTAQAKRANQRWFGWSVRYQWLTRAAAYDAHLDRVAQQGYQKRLQEARERHADFARAAQSALSAVIRSALTAIQDAEALQKLSDEAKKDPAKLLKLLDAVAKVAAPFAALVQVERLSLGMSTESVEVDDKREDPLADALARNPDALSQVAVALQALAG